MIDLFLNRSVKFHFYFAFILRVVFIFYGIYHDYQVEKSESVRHNQTICVDQSVKALPKYTDIDYQVFTDGAKYIYQGQSPYNRDTYRYTPFLAFIMQPNVFLNISFGKFIFIVFDVLCGFLIIKINDKKSITELNSENLKKNQKHTSRVIKNRIIPICFWFYNPITIAIGKLLISLECEKCMLFHSVF
jgi:hypothetical protein